MRKEKGFTLIELLAVIVILVIIALITTPITLNVMNKAKEKAFQNTVYGVIDEIRLLAAQQLFDKVNKEIIVHFENQISDNPRFKVSGESPDSGTIHLTQEGLIELKLWSKKLKKCIEKNTTEENISFTNTKEESCKIEISDAPVIAPKIFEDIMKVSDEVMNNDPDGTLRYVGLNPKNYIQFNNEPWRIIGIFNGQAKIIRNDYYSTSIAWNSANKNASNSTNDWSIATLQETLNAEYLSSINDTSKSLIDNTHAWKLGGQNSATVGQWTRVNMYSKERGNSVPLGSSKVWTGAIGIMYPSDYGYATSSTNTVCNTTTMNSWSSGIATTECRDKNWLYSSSNVQWTLTPYSGGAGTNTVFCVNTHGFVSNPSVNNTYAVRPVLYLKANVKVTSGTGTTDNPYILTQ